MQRRIPHPIAFWVVALMSTTALLASAAPSPLYPVYQQLWGFSSFTLTIIFAVYVVALVGTLLTVGSLSDHVGRRPVLFAAVVLLIVSMVIFLEADGVALLIVARVVQGLATGALVGTISAAMVDLAPSPRLGALLSSASPPAGLAAGAVLAGVLVQYVPLPRVIVYVVLIALLGILLVTLAFLPETSPRHGFTSRRHVLQIISPNISVPGYARLTFLTALPALMASWALGGLYLSLGSSITASILGVSNHAISGAILFAFFGCAAVAAALAQTSSTTVRFTLGFTGLGAGVLISMFATLASSAPAYIAGSVIAGIGWGITLIGMMSSITEVTAPADRGRVFAAVFAVCYTAFSVPAVVAGLAVTMFGLRSTAVGYAIFIMVLVASAAAAAIVNLRRAPAAEIAVDVTATPAQEPVSIR
ncbi:MFS transporter [Williamsia phyllosphaerae]|uniref:MFS transporter n=1 Tax=Williamsia phyllosphaerae TaxID=885042 RepID=A0ABQ1U419_9NOCA|nr:MFS transporter [Williamsia phyllosphaerae]GGF09512.1 MFS transporter [Williamsia phyllosphaerae]